MKENINLSLLNAGFEQCIPNKHPIDFVFPYTSLHYIVSGSGFFNGIQLHAGQFFCCEVNHHAQYYPDSDDPWAYYWFNITGNNQHDVLLSHRIDPEKPYGSFLCIDEIATIQKLYENYQRMYVDNLEFRETLAWMLFSLHQTNLNQKEKTSVSYLRMKEIRQYIDTNYNQISTVEEIAKTFFISRLYMRNQFIRFFQISPKQYLQKVRMENAARFLKETNYNISLIASSVGYCDIYLFSKIFKNYYGVAPSVFRKTKATE